MIVLGNSPDDAPLGRVYEIKYLREGAFGGPFPTRLFFIVRLSRGDRPQKPGQSSPTQFLAIGKTLCRTPLKTFRGSRPDQL